MITDDYSNDYRVEKLGHLRYFYNFCSERGIEDIEYLEAEEEVAFRQYLIERKKSQIASLITVEKCYLQKRKKPIGMQMCGIFPDSALKRKSEPEQYGADSYFSNGKTFAE